MEALKVVNKWIGEEVIRSPLMRCFLQRNNRQKIQFIWTKSFTYNETAFWLASSLLHKISYNSAPLRIAAYSLHEESMSPQDNRSPWRRNGDIAYSAAFPTQARLRGLACVTYAQWSCMFLCTSKFPATYSRFCHYWSKRQPTFWFIFMQHCVVWGFYIRLTSETNSLNIDANERPICFITNYSG